MINLIKKNFINPLLISFGMYSSFPVAVPEWNEENMRYSLALFPLVGVLEAFFYVMIFYLTDLFNINIPLRAGILSISSIIYTGGIHFDGFLDTIDALFSYQSRERKLEILKDSHVGAGAVIGALLYLLLTFASFLSFTQYVQIICLCFISVLARAFSAIFLVFEKNARGSGLAMDFTKKSDLKKTRIVLSLIILLSYSGFALYNIRAFVILFIVHISFCIYYIYKTRKEFGGLTGDLAGFFFCIFNLLSILVLSEIF